MHWPTAPEGPADVVVRSCPDPLLDRADLPWKTEKNGDVTLNYEGIASYVIRGGKEIDVHPHPEVESWCVNYYLKNVATAVILAQRGLVPLHASAVDTPEGAVLLLSRSGGGKSTFAGVLRQRGFPLLCDELSPVRLKDGLAELIPHGPDIQLPGSVLRHYGEQTGTLNPLRPGIDRFRLVPPAVAPTPSSRPVRAIIFLHLRETDDLEVSPLDAPSTLARLSWYLYRWRLLSKFPLPYRGPFGTRQSTLEGLVRSGPAFSLTCPIGLEFIEPAVDALVSTLSALKPPPRLHWSRQPTLPKYDVVDVWIRQAEESLKPGFLALASYPKSGNTWTRALLTAWHRGTQSESDLEFEGGAQMLECHTLEEELGVKASYLQNEDELARWRLRLHRHLFKYLDCPLPVKLHESSSRGPDGELIFPPDVMVGVVLIVRCPLDIVPSFANHFSVSLEEAVTILGSDRGWTHHPSSGHSTDKLPHRVGSWSSHARSWLDEPEHRCLVVRYEDLLADTVGQFKRIVEFSGETWDEARGRRAVDICRFEKLQAKEKQIGFKEKLRKSPIFFYQGKSGRWRDVLSPALCRQVCLDHQEMMRRLGYDAEVDEVLGAT